ALAYAGAFLKERNDNKMARGKGIPAIRQRKDKNGKKIDVWECMLNLGRDPGTGKLKRVPVYGKSQGECREKVIEALAQIQNQTFVEPHKTTLSQWLDTWLTEYKKGNIRPTTYKNYEYIIRVHLKDIGEVYLKDLKPEILQKFYNDKAKQKIRKGKKQTDKTLSPATIRYMHIVVHEALEQAIRNNLIVRNITEATTLPKQSKKEMRVLTVE
ncbi:MAG: site-specific integrase, partial [Desulfitobacteriaceae bacterium]